MKVKPCHLSVNVNKIATLRNSRGGDIPNVVQCAKDLIRFGAEGITIHPRPDGRHIKRQDVFDLRDLLKATNKKRQKRDSKIEYNIEGYPSADFMELIDEIRPDQATLVPDPPNVLTSNAGWKVVQNEGTLTDIIKKLRAMKVRSSLFIDVFDWSAEDLSALKRVMPDRIELYTEKYAKDYVTKARKSTTAAYAKVAREVHALGIDVNAGHDLSLENVQYLLKSVPEIVECSIGHALISESLYLGFQKTVQGYLREMRAARKKPK